MPEATRRPFFAVASAAFLAVVVTAGAVNWLVDPYAILHEWSVAGVTQSKPVAGRRGAVIKPILVERAGASTLVLGASQVDVGMDPRNEAWPAESRPVFNLGVPGSRPYAQLRYLQHAAYFHPPSLIVMCVDYLSFLEEADQEAPLGGSGSEPSLRVGFDGALAGTYRWQRFYELFSALFSIDSLAHSIETVAGQTGYTSLDGQGFSSGAERFMAEIAAKGQYSVVRDVVAAQARHLDQMIAPGAAPATFQRQLGVLDRVFELAERHEATVRLFIPPSHVYELENLRSHGLWGDFERWKVELTLAVERANERRSPLAPVTLTDFSGYHEIAKERVPAPGDLETVMRWYWEPVHFRTELGDRIIEAMFDEAQPSFGTVLDPKSVCGHLLQAREERDRYSSSGDARWRELFARKQADPPAWAGPMDERCGRAKRPARLPQGDGSS